ncbi:MAG: hypothetical protein HQL16_00800 [Candidatus Omnitrophica bacterium]|nr:hypothetical protein [Candidatus Omnitrophota bacterium]
MLFRQKIQKLFSNDWLIAAVILSIFLITNRYIFGWDDQHLEVPLLKHLIDPTLFQGDYYVESLKENFTTFLYPILSRFITVEQIPAAYFTLFLVARFFLFLFIYRLWRLVTGESFLAFLCTAALFLLIRPEEFIKRTFSHQVVSYPFVFAGIYLFYRSRYLAAAMVCGLAANFHALYGLFVMIYLSTYLLFFNKDAGRVKLFFKAALGFLVMASPFLVWTVSRAVKTRLGADPHLYDNWIDLYRISCPQNFLLGTGPLREVVSNFKVFLKNFSGYLFAYIVYLFHWCFNVEFRRDMKIHAVAFAVFCLTVITFLFTYIWPSHFVLDLNLVRNDEFLKFFVGGYTLIFAYREAQKSWWKGAFLAVLAAFVGGKESLDSSVFLATAGILLLWEIKEKSLGRNKALANVFFALVLFGLAYFLAKTLGGWSYPFYRLQRLGFIIALVFLSALAGFFIQKTFVRSFAFRLLVMAPFIVAIVTFCQLHYNYVRMTKTGSGFWQLQRNWEDMQFYVKGHTPKDAMFLTPYDMEMGGFRIHSNRKVIVCFRDCGIIGFDYKAVLEWQKRLKDIETFKVMIKEPFMGAIINAITKYKADYIVFMRYAAPPDNQILQKMYENEAFTLYKVMRNN